MTWLAAFVVAILEKIIPSLIERFRVWNDERLASDAYDKKVDAAKETYKNAKTIEEKDDAFKNLIGSIRNH